MSSLTKDLMFLVLQFLDEEEFKDTMHKLEQESSLFFNMKYFEEKVLAGQWDDVEKYIQTYIHMNDNQHSLRMLFEIRRQKYLEALDRRDKTGAIEILLNDLKVFSSFNDDLFKELTYLLTLNNFRENENFSEYGDTESARNKMLVDLKKLIEVNPVFKDKLIFPSFETSRLQTLLNQSWNWQHELCKNTILDPDVGTSLIGHSCPINLPREVVPKPYRAPLRERVVSFTPTPTTSNVNALVRQLVSDYASTSSQSPAVAALSLPRPTNQVSILKHPRTPNALGMMGFQNNDHELTVKRFRATQSVGEVPFPVAPQQSSDWFNDLIPRTVVCTLHQGSTITSMDFHPFLHWLLVVGDANGETSLWETRHRKRLVTKPFKAYGVFAGSDSLQQMFLEGSSISINRVSWSEDGNFIGVAFSKHLVHLYACQVPTDLQLFLEIDAHYGSVNDLAFSNPNKEQWIVTCGDDKLIKVWDLNGKKLFNFEGHTTAVFSICPHQNDNKHFILSASVDGKIKAWQYDNMGSRMEYEAPGQCRTSMLFSADGYRLFSCGTSKDGHSFLCEWNGIKGKLKKVFGGFANKSFGTMQFDTTKGRFLVAGEDRQIKFWDIDNVNVLISTEAGGNLPSLPRLKFNKEGSLLVVTTTDGGFKVLTNCEGIKYFGSTEARSFDASKALFEKKKEVASMPKMKRILDNDEPDKYLGWKFKQIVDPIQCRTVTMPDSMDPTNKVACLVYTHSGVGLLALGLKGIQRLWKWIPSELNPNGKATTSVVPQHWQPDSGLLMINDVPKNSKSSFPFLALSTNDFYVVSACGGKISLFNMSTFQVMRTFMPPPPIATCVAFHPKNNNILAIGMEDSTIHIFNVGTKQLKFILKGHQKHVTGLAFSDQLNILVSSGADAQLCFWDMESAEWNRMKSTQMTNAFGGDIRTQFHIDQVKLLVWYEAQLAIYDASKIELIQKWMPQDWLFGSLTSATYSCNGKLVYATFIDGNIGVFDADTLTIRCRIASSTYIRRRMIREHIYPIVVAAHPQEPNQFAIGLSDGSIKVLEPCECDGRWER